MNTNIARRDFIKKSGLAVSGMALASSGFSLTLPKDQVRLGIIGTGNRGTGLATVLQDVDEIALMACCDIQADRLANGMKLADKGAKSYSDYRKLLEDKNIDAVIISTPLYLHQQMAMDAIDAGKHVYCEKTMCYNIAQTLELAKRVKRSNLVFQVGHQYRNFNLYHSIYEKVKAGVIGEVKHFICHYNRNDDWRRPVPDPKLEKLINWRMYREYSGGPVAELSAHQIDMMNYMFEGPPDKITGFGSINYWKDGRETFDNVNLIFNYPGNVTGHVSCHLSNSHQPYVIKLLGDKGTYEILRDKAYFYVEDEAIPESQKEKEVVDGVSGATVPVEEGKAYPIDIKLGDHGPSWQALSHFAQCIKKNKTPLSNIDTGTQAAIAVDMANRAMENEAVERWRPEYNV